MHAAHALPDQIQAGISWYYTALAQAHAVQTKADADFAAESEALLRKEWGPDFDTNSAQAKAFMEKHAGEEATALEQIELKDGKFLLDHPLILKVMARAGLTMMEEPNIGLDSLPADKIQTNQARIEELKKDPNYWKSQAIQDEVTGLFEQLHGTEPIKGTAGPMTPPPG